ncbi:MAG: hypothetical protein IPO83_01905 [Chitinophagaceae bacterium]|nr:hypothetical protein [Chitinophagaceae bacterium]
MGTDINSPFIRSTRYPGKYSRNERFFENSNLRWVYTLIDKAVWLSEWIYPLLTIYLILVLASLRKLVLPMDKNISDIRGYLNSEVSRLDNDIDGRIRNLTNFTNTEINRIDNFREPLITTHRHHIAEVSYLKAAMMLIIIEINPNADHLKIRDYRIKAISHIFNSIIVSTAQPLQLLELKMYLEVANQILLGVNKSHIQEAKSTYNTDIPDVLLNLQKLDSGGALSIEIGLIKATIHKMHE